MRKQNQDYRDLLKEHILQKKKISPRHTQSYYANKIKVSKSYLTAVLSRRKHISPEKLDSLCRVLHLNSEDCLSVLLSYSDQAHSQKYIAKKLNSLSQTTQLLAKNRNIRAMSSSEKTLTMDEVRSTLFALMPNVPQGNLAKAHQSIHNKEISLIDVKKALSWLERKDFLSLEQSKDKKRYKARQSFIHGESPPGPQKYVPWLERAIQALESPLTYRPLRIQSMTFSFDDKALLGLQDAYSSFSQRVQELSDHSSANGKVYVLYLQNLFYTLASIDNESGDF